MPSHIVFICSKTLRISSHLTVLHVEQEVVGDDTNAVQSVLECLVRREQLLKEEREISAKLNSTRYKGGASQPGFLENSHIYFREGVGLNSGICRYCLFFSIAYG